MQFTQLKRREFITLLGVAAACPLAARAQQGERTRRIGVLMSTTVSDPEGQARVGAFLQGLEQLGWVDGRNLQIDIRWPTGNVDDDRKYAAELVSLAPDVILASAARAVMALQRATSTVPIVFAMTLDPVGGGIVESLSRPGGNTTGFMLYEYGLSGKWLELLKQIAPGATRVAVLRDATVPTGHGQFAVIQAMAPPLGLEVIPINVNHATEIERAVVSFARFANGGLIVTGSGPAMAHRKLIAELAARYRLPAVYPFRFFISGGGLISYGPDLADQHRGAATYVDRILKGAKPGDLPVQAPTKYELIINLRTAKAMGLEVPATTLARADGVIE
jgi:putative ABC transport system substrate-binding protein